MFKTLVLLVLLCASGSGCYASRSLAQDPPEVVGEADVPAQDAAEDSLEVPSAASAADLTPPELLPAATRRHARRGDDNKVTIAGTGFYYYARMVDFANWYSWDRIENMVTKPGVIVYVDIAFKPISSPNWTTMGTFALNPGDQHGLMAMEGTEVYFYAWSSDRQKVWSGSQQFAVQHGASCTLRAMVKATCPGSAAWTTRNRTPGCIVGLTSAGFVTYPNP